MMMMMNGVKFVLGRPFPRAAKICRSFGALVATEISLEEFIFLEYRGTQCAGLKSDVYDKAPLC